MMDGDGGGDREGVGRILDAMVFAAHKHRQQRRKDREQSPYINHPIDLANILVNEARVDDATVIVAAVLHDTVEDTATTFDEITARFGAEVSALVAEVTDDKTLPRDDRKRLQVEHAPHASFRAQQIKLADKIANLRDLDRSPPATWDLARKRAYLEWSKRVVDGLRGRHAALEALFDVACSRVLADQASPDALGDGAKR
jgi:guanosine-3',5'-bis(diphosphate) 3'-pyrophosphohydrolase